VSLKAGGTVSNWQ